MPKEKINHTNFEVKMYDFEPIKNSGFVRGKCRVAYAGENRNYTRIFKEAFDKATETVYNIPVVGNWIEAKENFGGHDVILETEGNDCKFKSNTIPYGVVPESCNPRWEEVTDDYGNTKSYFTVDVILWKERYQKQIEKVENDGVNQSMEIMVTEGDWDKDYEYFDVNDFYYSALCLLGRERDEHGRKGEDDVEPCFENAEVTTYSFDKKVFEKEFNFMLEEINKITKKETEEFTEEGGEKEMEENKTEEIVEEVETEKTNDLQEDNQEQENEQENDKTEEETNDDEIDSDNTEEDNVNEEDNTEVDNSVEETETNVKVEEIEEDNSQENETIEDDFKLKYEELSVEFSNLKIFKEDLISKNSKLEQEVKELRSYKETVENEKTRKEKEQIFNDYSLLLDEEDMQECKDNMDKFSIDEIQKKLAILHSMKSIAQAKKQKNNKEEIIPVENLKITNDSVEKETDKFAIK